MSELTKEKVNQFTKEATEALEKIAERHGLKLDRRTATYSRVDINMRLFFSIPGAVEEEISMTGELKISESEKASFRTHAEHFGMKRDDLGKCFRHCGELFRIVGIKPTRPKYPVNVVRSDGKRFKFPHQIINTALRMGGDGTAGSGPA